MASLRAALYIRVSTLDQAREGYSLAAQENQLLSEGTVHVVLTNPFYAGYNTWRRTLLSAGRQPKLFEPAYFNAVQRKIELNGARVGRARKHPLLYLPTQEYPIITPCF